MIAFVIGTRPEVHKVAPVVLACQERGLPVAIVSTSQHKDLLPIALASWGLSPDFTCDDERGFWHWLRVLWEVIKPEMVVVQGDTDSALAGALSAYQCGVPLAHIEAGLRTYDLQDPFPEEGNRQMIARLADLHFCPTQTSLDNLRSERVSGRMELVGNTVVPALAHALERARWPSHVARFEKMCLITIHRRENWDRLGPILAGIRKFAFANEEVQNICPMHPNPIIRAQIVEELDDVAQLIDPLPHEEFIAVLKASALVMTDSGGVEEEAFTLGIPTVVLRSHTERPEGAMSGNAMMPPLFDPDAICEAGSLMIKREVSPMSCYGDRWSGDRIAEILAR